MTQSSGTLNQSVLVLKSLSTISDNKPGIYLDKDESKEIIKNPRNIILEAEGQETQNYSNNTDVEKRRYEPDKKQIWTSKFSGLSSGSSEEEKVDAIQANKDWEGISRIVREEWDEEDEESQYEKKRKHCIDLEEPAAEKRMKNILKRNFSDDLYQ